MKLVGREYELKIIRDAIYSNRSELIILYGRRRIGKSYLLRALQEKSKDLYFEAVKTLSQKDQIKHFCKQLAEQTNTVPASAQNWAQAFDALTFHLTLGKRYIVFDEFPWMCSERQELVSILKYYWDNKWKDQLKVKLALCGSVANLMNKHVIHSHALHNRKTHEIRLDSLLANEAKNFFSKLKSNYEVLKYLMVFGGVPKYLEQIDQSQSFSKNMDRLCFSKSGFFVNEFETLFKEQFRVIKNYESIVKSLSPNSKTKENLIRDLKVKAGGGFQSFLTNLERASFIERQIAFNPLDGKSSSKTVRYCLSDEWLRFYFRYMQPNLNLIAESKQSNLYERLISPSIDAFFGFSFEIFCRKNISSLLKNADVDISQIQNFGPYFSQKSRSRLAKNDSKGIQIDLLCRERTGDLILVECKFSKNSIGSEICGEIEQKIKGLPKKRSASVRKILVTIEDPKPALVKSRYFDKIILADEFLR